MIRQSYTPSVNSNAILPAANGSNDLRVNLPKSQLGKTSGVDFTNVPAHDNDGGKKISVTPTPNEMYTTYNPDPSDYSTKIVFIQVMRESLDGVHVKPSVAWPTFGFQDATTTSDFYHVDDKPGESDPYYNGDDADDIGSQGNASTTPKVPATTKDFPNYPDTEYPSGKTNLLWEFSTAAFSAAGPDAGKYYGTSDWYYSKRKGNPPTIAASGTRGAPGAKFEAAVSLWNSVHGFTAMPSYSPPIGGGVWGGIIGGGAGAVVGAGLGALAGGVGGALVGGFLGGRAGATAGSRVGSRVAP